MPECEPIICVDGEFNASVSPLDRGLAYGDGLFETCRVTEGRVLLWDYHLERLQKSCQRLGLPLNIDVLEQQLNQVLTEAGRQHQSRTQHSHSHADGVLKLMVTRGVGGRGYRPPVDPKPMLCWIFYPGTKPHWTQGALEGIRLRICEHRLSENPILAGMKHLSRLDYVLARAEWGDEYPEGLLLDAQDRVIEGTISNVFAVSNGHLFTPSLKRSGVEGVMRRVILDTLAPQLSLSAHEEELPLSKLQKAEEVFICNSVFGIWPVIGIDGENNESHRAMNQRTDNQRTRDQRTVGPITRHLQQTWADWLLEARQ